MKYRQFGSIGFDVSVLGLGIQKLPVTRDIESDELFNQSTQMIQNAIEGGINYLDLGFPYQMKTRDRALKATGQALDKGQRDSVKLATTLPLSFFSTRDEVERFLPSELGKLNTDKIDCVSIGRLTRENINLCADLKVFDILEKARLDCQLDYIGFFFHDHFQILKQVIDLYDNWSFCQLQYSYMDVDHDPGISGVKYAAEKGLAVVVKEPLRSGRLTRLSCEKVIDLWEQAPGDKALEEWGLNFAWNDPAVSTVVTELENIERLNRSLVIADSAAPGNISIREEILINKVREAYLELKEIPCPSCRPCMPCEEGIDIPRVFEIYNDSLIYNDLETAQQIYKDERHNGSDCVECGLCSDRCAKELDIITLMKRAVQRLER